MLAGVKSAYERALERLAEQGIEPPRAGGLAEDVRRQIAAARQQTEAKLAELEILHRDRRREAATAEDLAKLDEEYVAERRRIEEGLERKVAKLRAPSSEG
jgi:MoxR-like ATPase